PRISPKGRAVFFILAYKQSFPRGPNLARLGISPLESLQSVRDPKQPGQSTDLSPWNTVDRKRGNPRVALGKAGEITGRPRASRASKACTSLTTLKHGAERQEQQRQIDLHGLATQPRAKGASRRATSGGNERALRSKGSAKPIWQRPV